MPSKYRLRPSSAQRFLTCTASLPFNEVAFQESKASLKGNLQHEVAQLRLEEILEGKDNSRRINLLMDYDRKHESDNTPGLWVKWDRQCDENVESYISYIKQLIEEYNPIHVYIEYKMKFKFYDNQMWGTADIMMVLPDYSVIVVDLKSGRGYVSTEDNPQMLTYGYAIIQEVYKKTKKVPPSVIISIHQNVINNISAMKYSINQMMNWYKKQAKPMNEINNDKLVFRPTKEGCKYCHNKEKCNERIKAGIY